MANLAVIYPQLYKHGYEWGKYDTDFFFSYSDINITAELFIADSKTITLSNPDALPSKLKLIREVKTANYCGTACHYKGYTYVGQNGGAIDKMDQQGNVIKDFSRLEGDVISIAAHEDTLYCLTYNVNSQSDMIHFFNINGEPFRRRMWLHQEVLPYWGSRMIVVNGSQFAVGDWAEQQIIIYSLTGDIIKKVPCHSAVTSTSRVTMTNCGENSVSYPREMLQQSQRLTWMMARSCGVWKLIQSLVGWSFIMHDIY